MKGPGEAGPLAGGTGRARCRAQSHSLGDLGVEVADPEAVPVLQGALREDGGVLQRQRLAPRLHGSAGSSSESGAGRGGGRGAGDGPGRGRTHHDTAGPRRPRPLPPRAGLAPPSAPLSDDVTPRRGPDDVGCNARGCATVSEAAGARPTPTRPLHRARARSLVPGPAAQPGPPWGTGGGRGRGGAGAS